MISNTETFYQRARQFQDKRAELVGEYEKRLQQMERYKGSKGYSKDVKKIRAAHEESLETLRAEYGGSLWSILDSMDACLDKRTVSPPSNEQLNLLSLIRMRKKVDRSDLDRVFQLIKDNPIAVGVLQEIAQENGIITHYPQECGEMSTAYAREVVQGMREAVRDFLKHDTTRSSRLGYEHNMRFYGVSDEPVKRGLFEDIEGCFKSLAGLDQTGLRAFSEAVDGQ